MPMPAARLLANPLLLWRLAFCGCLTAVLALALMKDVSPPLDTGWDKGNHLLAFGVLAFLGRMGFPGRRWLVPAGLLLYGIAIEVLQGLTGYRIAEYRDLLADLLGIAMGSLAAAAWLRYRRQDRQPTA
ncbi:VanZ family protein [Azotobacter sp. CWF10]